MSLTIKRQPSNDDYTSGHPFLPPSFSDSRAPCPALNALANHGYISRSGTNITFSSLLHATRHVYNLSYPLAFLICFVGFVTCGTISLHRTVEHNNTRAFFSIAYLLFGFLGLPHLSWTLDLSSLSTRGPTRIAHDASLVHPDLIPSSSPDPSLVADLLSFAQMCSRSRSRDGVSLHDLGKLHARRVTSVHHPLNWLHERIAEGECSLAWCVMRDRKVSPQKKDGDPKHNIIPAPKLDQWFGDERLPDGWWTGVRPSREVGLLEAGKHAGAVRAFLDEF